MPVRLPPIGSLCASAAPEDLSRDFSSCLDHMLCGITTKVWDLSVSSRHMNWGRQAGRQARTRLTLFFFFFNIAQWLIHVVFSLYFHEELLGLQSHRCPTAYTHWHGVELHWSHSFITTEASVLEILSLSHNSEGGTTSHQRYNSFVLKLLLVVRTLLSYLSPTTRLPPQCTAS